MPKLIIASIPRSGRTLLVKQLNNLGVTTAFQCVKQITEVSHAEVIASHDFHLDLYDPTRYTIRILRDPEECLKSWYLLDARQGALTFNRDSWIKRRESQMPYILGFNDKYRFQRTFTFEQILNNPNEILEEICYMVGKPFTPQEIPKHTPRDLNIYPFI